VPFVLNPGFFRLAGSRRILADPQAAQMACVLLHLHALFTTRGVR